MSRRRHCAILDGMTFVPSTRKKRLMPARLQRDARPPWSVRIGVLAAAVVVITVFTGGVATAVLRGRRTAPPQPAPRPPRVDDPSPTQPLRDAAVTAAAPPESA